MTIICIAWIGILLDAFGCSWGWLITASAALAGIVIIREDYRHERN